MYKVKKCVNVQSTGIYEEEEIPPNPTIKKHHY